jgi:Zn-dependent protease with chaperone function
MSVEAEKRRLPGLSPQAYEHPSDRAALRALRALPGFDTVVRRLFGTMGERALRLAFLGSAVRVSARQLPSVHERHLEACAILDVDPPPELFVAQAPFVNAGTIGVDRPFIVVHSGTLGLLDADELRFLLGHELGHVLSGHALYKTMLRLLLRTSSVAFSVPVGGAALLTITAALLEWDRCSEFSADRAGLLATQSPELARRVTMKLAGGTHDLNLEELLVQAEEYRSSGAVADSVLKILNLLGQPHAFPVLRMAELSGWASSGAFEQIRCGRYLTRAEAPPPRSLYQDLLVASRGYGAALVSSGAPVARSVGRAGTWALRSAQGGAQALGKTMLAALRRRRGAATDAVLAARPTRRRKRRPHPGGKK